MGSHIEKVGKVNREQLENIVKTKEGDLTAGDQMLPLGLLLARLEYGY